MKRIHIVGVGPRCGTTLMAECITSCFQIDGVDHHENQVRKLRWGLETSVTKWPHDIRVVGPRLQLDGNFHVICLLRDPRNVVVSVHRKYPDCYLGSLALWKREVCGLIRFANHERFTVVRYEDFVRAPDQTQRMLMRRMSFLRKTSDFSSFHERVRPSEASVRALSGVRPIEPDDPDAWKQHLPRVAGQIARHGSIDNALIATGYEPDDNWRTILDGVEPDLSDSRYEYPRPWQSIRIIRAWIDCLFVLTARRLGFNVG